MKKGIVYLVGAGPGDPRLLTEKGKQLLKTADVVVYDRLVGLGILSMIPEGIETINVGKTAGNHPDIHTPLSSLPVVFLLFIHFGHILLNAGFHIIYFNSICSCQYLILIPYIHPHCKQSADHRPP